MIDHVSLRVKDLARAKRFFEEALAPLGYKVEAEYDGGVGFSAGKPDFWIGQHPTGGSAHVAFSAPDRKSVDAFWDAAIKAGGRDNGKPGLRTDYHPNYYAAFVIDAEGNNIEAVCHHRV